MAIIDNNQNNQTTQSAQQAAPQAQQPQQGQQAMRQPWSFHQQGLIGSPVAAGVGGEYFTKFRTSLTEIYKDIVEGVEVRIISLNRQNMPSLRFSSLVVACRMNTVNSNAVAFHQFVNLQKLHDSGNETRNKVHTTYNRRHHWSNTLRKLFLCKIRCPCNS